MNGFKTLNAKLMMVFYGLVMALAGLAVNTACHSRFYQEELDAQLDSLKKYHD